MRYHVYLFDTYAASPDALCIGDICDMLLSGGGTNSHLRPFPANCVKSRIEAALPGLCHVLLFSAGASDYLRVCTSYEVAASVLPTLFEIAADEGIVLWNCETGKLFWKREAVDPAFLACRIRPKVLIGAIRKTMHPIYKIRQLEMASDHASYAVTLDRDSTRDFAERTADFWALLQANILPEETLLCENGYFSVIGEEYRLAFTLEGCGKHADRRGIVEKGIPATPFLHRDSSEIAFRRLKWSTPLEEQDLAARMAFQEMVEAYPDPGDRMAAAIGITVRQRNLPVSIRYSGTGGIYGEEVCFFVLPTEEHPAQNLSSLKIRLLDVEEWLLPLMDPIYSPLRKRIYDMHYLPIEFWKALVAEMKNACPQFKMSGQKAPVALFNVFIRWSEAQFAMYDDEPVLVIQGP